MDTVGLLYKLENHFIGGGWSSGQLWSRASQVPGGFYGCLVGTGSYFEAGEAFGSTFVATSPRTLVTADMMRELSRDPLVWEYWTKDYPAGAELDRRSGLRPAEWFNDRVCTLLNVSRDEGLEVMLGVIRRTIARLEEFQQQESPELQPEAFVTA